MKKYLFIICFFSFASNLKAQTLEQTTEFIEITIEPYSLGDTFISFQPDSIKYTNSYHTDNENDFESIKYNNIKSVGYHISKAGNGTEYIWIDIVGKVLYYDKDRKAFTKETSFELRITNRTPIPIVEKLIKAIKHAAVLQGAKLVNENMF